MTPLQRLVEAVDRCESNRGRFSCSEAHDSRCLYAMRGAARRKEPTVCACGALELDAAMEQARTVLAAQATRPATAGGGEPVKVTPLERALTSLVNQHSQENASNTPDFILAKYLLACLGAWNTGVQQRETWYGRDARPATIGGLVGPTPTDADVEAVARAIYDEDGIDRLTWYEWEETGHRIQDRYRAMARAALAAPR